MMDHYEELGVGRSASTAEIHQAYRRLMQLLHPDHCKDEAGRRLAELQARRLNGILAVLSDPVERERYDRELALGPEILALAVPPPAAHPHAPAWWWPVAIAAAVVSLTFVAIDPRREAVEPPPAAPPTPVAPSATSKPRARPFRPPATYSYSGRRQFEVRTAAAAAPESPSARDRRDEAPAILPLEPPQTELPAGSTAPPPYTGTAFADAPVPPPRSTLAGEWLFLPQPGPPRSGLYPPEFIELRVTEEAGLVRGKYRARYRVGDRAISPNVAFEFEGRAGDSGGHLPWFGPGGSSGQVTLRLLPDGALEVNWSATELGNELGLISGTAILVRRMD